MSSAENIRETYFGGSDYVEQVAGFNKPHVRTSLKAGTPEDFTRRTGVTRESFEIPFQGIRNLLRHNASFHVAAMSADPRIMSRNERAGLIQRLVDIDLKLVSGLEEEVVDPYETTLARLRYAGVKLEWPLREIYSPARAPMRGEFLRRRLGSHTRVESKGDH